MVTDTPKGFVHQLWEFCGKALDTTNDWSTNSDSGGTAFAISAVHGGTVVGSVDTTDNDITNLIGTVIWAADQGGPLTLEARVKLYTSVADGESYIGWTDATTDEMPMTLSTADVLTSTADDAVGFMYTGAGTASWKVAGTKLTADTAVTACDEGGATTPVVATWQTFKIALNVDGDADCYINGVWQARVDNAVTAATLLAPFMGIQSGGTARSMYVDYVDIWAGRVAS